MTSAGTLTLSDSTITTSGNTSSQDNSTVYYDKSACPALSGQTYSLSSGGTLTPIG